jgi:hypothetical protein
MEEHGAIKSMPNDAVERGLPSLESRAASSRPVSLQRRGYGQPILSCDGASVIWKGGELCRRDWPPLLAGEVTELHHPFSNLLGEVDMHCQVFVHSMVDPLSCLNPARSSRSREASSLKCCAASRQ